LDGDRIRFTCSFCRAEFDVPKTFRYATCPYCGTTFRIDNPGVRIDHYLFMVSYDKNSAYRLVKEFALMQVGIAEDFETATEFESAYQYLIPLYIYEVNVKAICGGGKEEVGDSKVEIDIHGGEEAAYIVTPAAQDMPIKIPVGYSFPARGRRFFKPTIVREGMYLQPSLDPETVFRIVKEPYINKVISEAVTACGNNYNLVDSSKYIGVAHYPFWLVKYRYRGNTYTSIVDASDGTVLHLEYPISSKSRVVGLVGGVATTIIAAAIGGIITGIVTGTFIYGLLGGAVAALPALGIAVQRFIRSKGVYRYKPSEEAVFVPVR